MQNHKDKPAEAQASCNTAAVEERADATQIDRRQGKSPAHSWNQTTLPRTYHVVFLKGLFLVCVVYFTIYVILKNLYSLLFWIYAQIGDMWLFTLLFKYNRISREKTSQSNMTQ